MSPVTGQYHAQVMFPAEMPPSVSQERSTASPVSRVENASPWPRPTPSQAESAPLQDGVAHHPSNDPSSQQLPPPQSAPYEPDPHQPPHPAIPQGYGATRPSPRRAIPWDHDPMPRPFPTRMTYYQAVGSYPNPADRVPAMYYGTSLQAPPASAPPTTLPVWTPISPGPGGYTYAPSSESHNMGTIQPSVFPSWQSGFEAPGHAAHPSIFTGGTRSARERSKGPNRLDGRRSSTPGRGADQWDGYNPFAAGLSRSTSEPSSSGEEVVKAEEEATEITYTTDGEAKQTQWVRRKCHNCGDTSPPNWRRSMLAKGKILCNRCGIYERTHRRARPPQSKKLRKGSKRPVQDFSPEPQMPQIDYTSSNDGSPHAPTQADCNPSPPVTAAMPAGSIFGASTSSVPLLSSSALGHPSSIPNNSRHSHSPYGLATPMTSSTGSGPSGTLRPSPYGYPAPTPLSAGPGVTFASSAEAMYGRPHTARSHPGPHHVVGMSPSSHQQAMGYGANEVEGNFRSYWDNREHGDANIHPSLRDAEGSTSGGEASGGA